MFKRPKNREDGSDFDGNWTNQNRSDATSLMKKGGTNETNKKFPKNSKNHQTIFRKILKIAIADVINY